MALISVDNGNTYMTAAEAMPKIMARKIWGAVLQSMDDDIFEMAYEDLPSSHTCEELLAYYLWLTDENLIIN